MPSQIKRLERSAGCSLIAPRRSSSAHLHRPWRATCAHPRPDFRDCEGLSSAATRDIGPMTGFALKSKISDEKLATAATLGQLEETPDDSAASLFAYDLALHSSLSRRHDN